MASLQLQSHRHRHQYHHLLLSYTKQLTSLVNVGQHHQALTLFSQMLSSPEIAVDHFAFPLALKSSAALRLPIATSTIHSRVVKSGMLSNPFVASALVDSYGKSTSVSQARKLFDELPQRNVVVWNAMISLYSRSNDVPNALRLFDLMDIEPNASSFNSIIATLSENGDDGSSRALELYQRMRVLGIKANLITVLALLPACVGTGALSSIKEVHGFAIRNHIHPHSHLGSALVGAYGRCGCLVNARRIFDRMEERDVVVWSSMVSAYAFHGDAYLAMSLFRQMEADNVWPDGIMFLGILKACSHSGLAKDAMEYFEIMRERHGLEAGCDHYACLVDVLSRAGRVNEAYDVIRGMPVKVTAKAWGALLGACRNYGEVELAEIAARELFEMEPDNAGNYVLLASTYSRAGKLEEAERVRREMAERDVQRSPGSSWVVSHKS